ncbi:hypothetical protein ABZV67_26315 [Streptomyces sp. NPDC005065]|uniref:hypothetical protein n=1 Tax=unclassified Streptomyces TaxID=2593676 RepID=UPI0033B43D33
MAVVDERQPQAMVFNLGRPTIRWVGNEDGLASDPCRYVTDSTDISLYRDGQAALDTARCLPPECDVPTRSASVRACCSAFHRTGGAGSTTPITMDSSPSPYGNSRSG